MNNINDLSISKREPEQIPGPLLELLKDNDLSEGIVELVGIDSDTVNLAVYGYYIPAIKSIICPNNTWFRRDITMPKFDIDYGHAVSDWGVTAMELMCEICGIEGNIFESILAPSTDQELQQQIIQKAISNTRCRMQNKQADNQIHV